jgi:Na+/proline symporter
MLELGNDAMLFMAASLVLLLALGVLGRVRRREESFRDFYLGGSGFGFLVLFLTFFATQFSGYT